MMLPALILIGVFTILAMLVLAFSGPSPAKAATRRLSTLRTRHSETASARVEAQLRRIAAGRASKIDHAASRLLPNPTELAKRLERTGKGWTLGQYAMASAGIAVVTMVLLWLRGLPLLIALFVGIFLGAGIPHKTVGYLINRRVNRFTVQFPDAIDLLVRGLRSGLPITETIGVVGTEVSGPTGEEFRSVADKMKIGRPLDAALQETADRLGTPEFQFFVITIQIQRETGGNLAETLSNLADVLRKRAQMKLKIRAMSSESKASAYIVGSLPFIVFAMIMWLSPDYMLQFFQDPRLIVAGLGGMIWMAIGAFIMAKMVSFEI
ncbi:tight adherence protein B [Stakelama pacifica]|uniref:Tight adherence protein B n=2 Tax=Stakelama pacifica TaxID=517720 RepID=A0A4R6FQ31_9SPHN|nr:type II secretion system F family protein [Stakelama pacifica]TDN83733.1 tight adherence protein B [Stakelama pacifica]GGO94668.1 secretion protein F [Stakelama pacifica]